MRTLAIKILGSIYGCLALLWLPSFLSFLVFGPSLNEAQQDHFVIPYISFGIGFPIINISICGLICYSFWNLRSWGRILAIIYNAAYLIWLLLGFISRLHDSPPITGSVILLFIAFLSILGGIVTLLMRASIRNLMNS